MNGREPTAAEMLAALEHQYDTLKRAYCTLEAERDQYRDAATAQHDAYEAERDTMQADLAAARRALAVCEPAAKNWPAMLTRCERAEAAYQEAQTTIAGLEAERDHYRKAGVELIAERDAARAEVARLQGRVRMEDHVDVLNQLAAARAEVARLRELLHKSEWTAHDEWGDPLCWACFHYKHKGHDADCPLSAALKGA